MAGGSGLPKRRVLKDGLESARRHKLFTVMLVASFFVLGGIAAVAAEELEEVIEGEEDDDDGGRDGGDVEYEPVIEPSDFVGVVDNPYLPLTPGSRWVYEGTTEDGLERIVVEVTNDTRQVLGVTCVVVRDTVTVDGEVAEDTWDWFAQDVHGNVWYFGEDTKEYEDGKVVSTEGAWEAGVDGARPGIVMLASPLVGLTYRQEYYEGEAEDMAEVLALDGSVTTPSGTYDHVLRTKEWTPLEPGVAENKYYAPGVGCVLEVMTRGGDERVELVEFEAG